LHFAPGTASVVNRPKNSLAIAGLEASNPAKIMADTFLCIVSFSGK